MSYFRAENLSLHFGGLKAVDAVSFAVEKGEILSIIGPNGAGKSSIFNLISRIYRPTSGRIFFEDQDITEEPPYDIAKLGIARTFQNIELFENATVLSNLLVGVTGTRPRSSGRSSCSCRACGPTRRCIAAGSSRSSSSSISNPIAIS